MNENSFVIHRVKNRKGKPFGKQPVIIFVWLQVDAAIKTERFDVRIQVRQKIVPNSGLLCFLKMKSLDQISFRLIEYFDVHDVCPVILRLAVSQSVNRALPSRISRSRSSRRSLCH